MAEHQETADPAREIQTGRDVVDNEKRYRELFENSSDLLQIVCPDRRLRHVNRSWLDTLGYSHAEALELDVGDLLSEQDVRSLDAAIARLVSGQRVEPVEFVFLAKDGESIAVEGSLTCRLDDDGQLLETLGIFRDVTQRKAIEQMKAEFMSAISHDLRAPLTSIIASLALLRTGRLEAKPQRKTELVEIADRNGRQLLDLVNDLVDLQRLAEGKMDLCQEPIPLAYLMQEVVGHVEPYARSLNVEVALRPCPTDTTILADGQRLVQVMQNLLSNAIKFSPEDGRVGVWVTVTEETVSVAVSDEGPGIPMDFQRRLVEKEFTDIDSSTERNAQGSGLGLSITKSLVEKMLGTIRLDSSIGAGTTLYVEFRRAEPLEDDQAQSVVTRLISSINQRTRAFDSNEST